MSTCPSAVCLLGAAAVLQDLSQEGWALLVRQELLPFRFQCPPRRTHPSGPPALLGQPSAHHSESQSQDALSGDTAGYS